ncbi:MAG: KH domain-containing protein [Elusimicrobiota bacterium]
MKTKDLTTMIVKRLVDKPEAVSIEETQDGDTNVLKVLVDEADKGKVIGKQGKVIKAIRFLAGVAAAKDSVRVAVEID